MNWEKLGLRFIPRGDMSWSRSHAATPCGVWRPDGMLRTYFTTRDDGNRSHIGWVDLDPVREFMATASSSEPVLAPGAPGLFDDSGVGVGCVVATGETELLYYIGWNLKVTVPWMNTIGLATRTSPDAPFEKRSRVPVLDRSEEDPYSLSYPWVITGESGWDMWYGSNLSWGATQQQMAHAVKHAHSRDGIHWTRETEPVVDLLAGEYALSRPQVRKLGSTYEMFFSRRGTTAPTSYRIGFATSDDGVEWSRKDESVGLDVSTSGWDSDMVCYPFVFEYAGDTWMLYNGNGYGRTGFGIARLV